MKSILLLLIISTAVLAGHHQNHKCVHDTISQRIPDREVTDVEFSEDDERHLQTAKPRNMKITYDMAFFDKLSSSPED